MFRRPLTADFHLANSTTIERQQEVTTAARPPAALEYHTTKRLRPQHTPATRHGQPYARRCHGQVSTLRHTLQLGHSD
jgi:hypothetical protein